MTVEDITHLWGWALAINLGVLVIAAFFVTVLRDWCTRIHSNFTSLDQKTLHLVYFKWMANYKIITTAFFLAPYLALRIGG